MEFLLLFAFLAGIVTILSPCILPLLPIILSSSVTGSKKYPWGVVTGFILSFTFFTLFLTAVVDATGLSANFVRTLAIVVVFGFGLVLVVPKLQVLFEIFASKLATKGQKIQSKSDHAGFKSGCFVGLSLGLVWTPCVGPILASVISLALVGAANSQAVFITLAYAIGTAIPMLAILYGGRTLVQKVPALTRNLGRIQKVFGVLMILTAIALFFNFDRQFQSYILEKFPNYGAGLTQFEENEKVQKQLDVLRGTDSFSTGDLDEVKPAPELIQGGEWFNSDPLTLEELEGKVVLVDFWTYSCINCIRTLPYLRAWHEKYSDDGLVIIGVHAPEFEFEKNPNNLRKAIEDFELEYPIMQDNNFETWRAYENHWWPSKFLVDHEGQLVYNHHGEGKYEETEQLIQKLLSEAGYEPTDSVFDASYSTTRGRTPETYLGYRRTKRFASGEIKKDEMSVYGYPESLEENEYAYSGGWTFFEKHSLAEKGSKLKINFSAQNVYLVMSPALDEQVRVAVYVDGEQVKTVTVDADELYTLAELDQGGTHELELEFLDGNTKVYAFTFG